MARALGRGGPRGGRGGQRDPRARGDRRHDRGARVRPRRRGPRAPGSTRGGRPSSAGTCPRATRPRPRPPPPTVAEALGHLQAFGLRPIGELRTRLVARGGLGRGLEGVLPGAAGRPADRHPADLAAPPPRPDDVVLALDPGHGLRDRPPPDDAAVPRGARGPGRSRGASPAPACSTSAAARGSWPSRRSSSARPRRSGVDTDPIADRGDRSRTRARNRLTRRIRGARRQPAERRAAVRRRPGQPDRRRPRAAGAAAARRAAARWDARWPPASSSIARPRCARRSRRPACVVGGGRPRAMGRAGGGRPALTPPAPALQSRAMPATFFPILLATHIALAISLFLPSILLPFALRTRRATVESESGVVRALLVGADARHGRHRGRARGDRPRPRRRPRAGDAPAALAARRPRDLLPEPRDRVLHPAAEPAATRRHHGRRRRCASGRSGPGASATCRT